MADNEIIKNGWISTLKKARTVHECISCHSLIAPGDQYWHVVAAGSGLGYLKFPDRYCIQCMCNKISKGEF